MIERRKLNLFQKYNLHEALVNSGIIRDWFVEFADYWTNCLSGRKITIQDFHWLHGNYRARRQITEKLEWASETQHVENWQDYRNIADVFNHVYKYSLMPIREARFDVMLPRQHCCVLEYGCGMAPMYRTYKKYFYYLQAKWQLADIQSFNFHFTRHAYAKDIDLDRFITIKPGEMLRCFENAPDNSYDLIIAQEVFEHLRYPIESIKVLTRLLKPEGFLYFDYCDSKGYGLDTSQAVDEREAVLDFVRSNYKIASGKLGDTVIAVRN